MVSTEECSIVKNYGKKFDSNIQKEFEINKEVTQEDFLSMILFNIVLLYSTVRKNEENLKTSSSRLNVYAHDIVALTKNRRILRETIEAKI